MQHVFVTALALFGLSINVSAMPAPQNDAKHANQPCYEDNPLRALERFTSAANSFCPGFLSTDGKGDPPEVLGNFQQWEFYSACSCYEKTASGDTKPTSAGILDPTSSGSSGGHPAFASTTEAIDTAPIGTATIPSLTIATAPLTAAAAEKDSVSSTPASGDNAKNIGSPSAALSSPAVTSGGGANAAPAASASVPSSSIGAGSPARPIKPGSKGKRGIAYNYKSQPNWSTYFKGSPYAVWGSNWDDKRTDALDSSFTYVPTIVVDNTLTNNNWLSTIPALISSGSTTIFGSNEPDNAGQANLPVPSAAAVHEKYLQPFAGQAALGTPAVTNGGSPSGLTYLDAFAAACANCTFNFINVHFYLQRSDGIDPAQFAAALKTHIDVNVPAVQDKHENLKGLPVVIGEFWLQGSTDQEGADLLVDVLPYLDANERVLGYQAFGGLWEGNWITADGSGLTPAGQKYNTYSAAVASAS